MTDIDGIKHYDLADVQAGLCDPAQLWKPVPQEVLPVVPPEQVPPTAAQLRADVLAAYNKLGGVKYLTSLAEESPPAFLKLLTNALHHQTPGDGADLSQLSREEHRQLQIAEQYAVITAHRPASLAGDAKASEVIIKASDRLAKLLGTDQPRLVANFNTDVGAIHRLTDAELEQIARRGLTLVQGDDGTYSEDGQ